MNKRTTEIDKNFKVETTINRDGMDFYNAENAPFRLYGVFRDGADFCRMPVDAARKVSGNVEYLNYNTCGGRVKFKTDSGKISIIAKLNRIQKMPHFAFTGSVGFDLYVKKDGQDIYRGTYIPDLGGGENFESSLCIDNDGMNEITINFPLYSGVSELYIGVKEGSSVAEADDYAIEKPVVFYGSSITQGGCASRPGNSYQAILSRMFDFNYINLGFMGSALGEDAIMDYIASLEMTAFIYDYDYNAPSFEHLEATHERGFKKVRTAHPDMPIVIMTRPQYYMNPDEEKCSIIIKKTYDNAIASGDKNVYFLDGKALMEIGKDSATVDNCHPNDLGFYSMAKALEKVFKNIW